MSVGAGEIREEIGIGRVGLGAGSGVAGAGGLDGVGVNGCDGVPGIDQGINCRSQDLA